MKTKFTPGPWSCVQLGDGYEVLMGEHASMITGKDVLYMEDDKHNAYLIAAAPDLYEALESVIFDNHALGHTTPETLNKIEGALLKARGESVTEASPVSLDQIKSELTTGTVSLENYLRHNFEIYRKVK